MSMRHLRFWLRHAVPRTNVTECRDDQGRRQLHVWRQWGRRVWNHRHVQAA